VIVGGIYAWRTHDLLPADERTAAPTFDLVDLDGRRWTPETLNGKPAVLYFFAPWCGVCAASAPQLRWFDHWVGDDVQVVLVGLDWSSDAS
jgi:thiol-disulfide isomerase/thioredoxin